MRGSNTVWGACLATIVGFSPASARAQAPELPPAVAAYAQEVAQRLEENELAGDRILLKAKEGVAKGIPAARINAVLDAIERDTLAAAEIIDGARLPKINTPSRRQFVRAMADALGAGASRANMEELVGAARGRAQIIEPLAASAVAMADLLVAGYDEARARDLLVLALERGFGARDFTNLMGALQGMRADVPAAMALEEIFAKVGAGERPVPIDGLWGGAANVGGEVDVRLPAPAASKSPPAGIPTDRPGRP